VYETGALPAWPWYSVYHGKDSGFLSYNIFLLTKLELFLDHNPFTEICTAKHYHWIWNDTQIKWIKTCLNMHTGKTMMESICLTPSVESSKFINMLISLTTFLWSTIITHLKSMLCLANVLWMYHCILPNICDEMLSLIDDSTFLYCQHIKNIYTSSKNSCQTTIDPQKWNHRKLWKLKVAKQANGIL
jgi:hypothetical protein